MPARRWNTRGRRRLTDPASRSVLIQRLPTNSSDLAPQCLHLCSGLAICAIHFGNQVAPIAMPARRWNTRGRRRLTDPASRSVLIQRLPTNSSDLAPQCLHLCSGLAICAILPNCAADRCDPSNGRIPEKTSTLGVLPPRLAGLKVEIDGNGN